MNDLVEAALDGDKKRISFYQERLKNVRLTPRNRLILQLWAMGVETEEIVRTLKIKRAVVNYTIHSDKGKEYLRLILQEKEVEFHLLFGKVVKHIRVGLDSTDFEQKDKAARLWATMSGRVVTRVHHTRSAEDNVKDLLEGKVIEVEEDASQVLQEGNRNAFSDTEQEG